MFLSISLFSSPQNVYRPGQYTVVRFGTSDGYVFILPKLIGTVFTKIFSKHIGTKPSQVNHLQKKKYIWKLRIQKRIPFKKLGSCRGAWVVQSVKRPTLDFSSGQISQFSGFESVAGSAHRPRGACLGFSLSLCPSLTRVFSDSLTINK